MNVCPICGFRNPDQNVRCFRCEALLKHDDAEYDKSMAKARSKTKADWLVGFWGSLERMWQGLPTRRLWEVPENLTHRFPWTAAGLSILPGLGQLYNQQFGKAAFLAAVWWSYAVFCLFTLTTPLSNWLLLGLLLVFLLIWNDALVSAIRINGQGWSLRNSVAAWFALMFMAGIVITALQFLLPFLIILALIVWTNFVSAMFRVDQGHWSTRGRFIMGSLGVFLLAMIFMARQTNSERVFTFVRIFKDVHAPVLDKGDMVFVNNMSYWFREPAFGEMVHCDPGPITIEQSAGMGTNVYRINIEDYFQRVIGLPGDRIERKDGKYYRNGSPFPEDIEPIRGDLLPDGTFEVPAGKYFCPITKIPGDFTGNLASLLHMSGPQPTDIKSHGIMKGWFDSSMLPKSALYGHAIAVMNPPTHRRWIEP